MKKTSHILIKGNIYGLIRKNIFFSGVTVQNRRPFSSRPLISIQNVKFHPKAVEKKINSPYNRGKLKICRYCRKLLSGISSKLSAS